jgi:hypothetical protein
MMLERHTSAFKAKIVQELFRRGEVPTRELQPTMGFMQANSAKRRATAIDRLPSLFKGGTRREDKGEADDE